MTPKVKTTMEVAVEAVAAASPPKPATTTTMMTILGAFFMVFRRMHRLRRGGLQRGGRVGFPRVQRHDIRRANGGRVFGRGVFDRRGRGWRRVVINGRQSGVICGGKERLVGRIGNFRRFVVSLKSVEQ